MASATYGGDALHVQSVAAVIAQVRDRPQDKILSVTKATRSHTPHTKGYKIGAHLVDVSALRRILKIDPAAKTVTVEGQVSMKQLCEETLRYGLAIPVVPELSAFTVAGLINGLGIQSSSHKYGLFPDNLVSFEAVVADGRCIVASADSEPELFWNLPGSYGSLGIVTAATIRLIPAGPFVVSKYYAFTDMARFSEAVTEAIGHAGQAVAANTLPLFVEGFVYSRSCAVLVCSDYSWHPGGTNAVFHATAAGEEWYHQHALVMGTRAATLGLPYSQDALPSLDYLFRLERGYWWFVDHIVGLHTLTSPLGLGGWLGIDRQLRTAIDMKVAQEVKSLPTGVSSWAGQSANPSWTPEHMHACMVHQDMGVRLGRLNSALTYVMDQIGVHPVWVCPFRVITQRGALWNAGWTRVGKENVASAIAPAAGIMENGDEHPNFPLMAVDLGLYGEPTAAGFKSRSSIRALQRYVDVPAFWGMSYLTREELESVYDFPVYEATRKMYGAQDHGEGQAKPAFPDIRAKTSFWDPSKPDLPPLTAWRLQRAGLLEQTIGTAVGMIALGAVGAAAALGWAPFPS